MEATSNQIMKKTDLARTDLLSMQWYITKKLKRTYQDALHVDMENRQSLWACNESLRRTPRSVGSTLPLEEEATECQSSGCGRADTLAAHLAETG